MTPTMLDFCQGKITTRHRGLLLYLAKTLLGSQPHADTDEVHRL
jgi:hypothetical protein